MELSIKSNKREELIDITDIISEKVEGNGIVHIFVPHATAAVTINENADPNLPKDITQFLHDLVPQGKWMHDQIDHNADSHIKATLVGNSVSVPFKDGELQLGRWQNIFLCEFDGPRERKVLVNNL